MEDLKLSRVNILKQTNLGNISNIGEYINLPQAFGPFNSPLHLHQPSLLLFNFHPLFTLFLKGKFLFYHCSKKTLEVGEIKTNVVQLIVGILQKLVSTKCGGPQNLPQLHCRDPQIRPQPIVGILKRTDLQLV